ncbi:Ribosomal RNA large subunit methyltransferase M-23S rRNA 2'-O-ribose methyltransferase rlmM [Moritella viscosa]|uniref:Ribosomal RNA large subunit methyltransferase M n=1 Tax=Moritella viscosa TaxID=80854 RepID=A0A090IGL3_9GAMM|nr:23S rRNA (cytidine(2498)-2'-O)-methyltransferase RlmM [Moritella viscosa]CED61765.1 ribosomal RNA large subunit methyltransferase M [Moritella viscosa]SGY99581.1 Ribosomal RNA large subunit methyltransferase M-23S rRNA 2'-O-ribose methyltransferase rlmM [Moritella viscosa]SHO06748.1 Ribosomal RNA large subunit methyltransferase M-23S rRNA 2'-O-ribose methyltransferase rlmM [Moritella viscosa]SHO09289.1 Ribosomal RNA large subunit methyltransferase M-23S rRNA 2'-O-ribose methyltransferase rlm
MNGILLYCRPGYEKECAAEIQARATAMEAYGFAKVTLNSGYVVFECHSAEDVDSIAKKLPLSSLIFARQMIALHARVDDMPLYDRVNPVVAACDGIEAMGELRVEMPDTNEGKELSKFCRKYTVPLRQSLRKGDHLLPKENKNRPVLHVFFITNTSVYIGYSYSFNNSPLPMGIMRLKFPSKAPSRSTLKLEEAFHTFIPADQWDKRIGGAMRAVDLGACPGGWTYQLVQRSMFVVAIDNGAMADSLMETGQVKHFEEDGFKYEPAKTTIAWTNRKLNGNKIKVPENPPVDMLVCDMIEKPERVARLMCKWLLNAWCKEAIFNLKLPLKRRYHTLEDCLAILDKQLDDRFVIQAKHLYHDRDEVTVHVAWAHFIPEDK